MTLSAIAVALLLLWASIAAVGALLLALPPLRARSAVRALAFRLLALGFPAVVYLFGREVQLRYLVDRSETNGLRLTDRAWFRRHVTPQLNSDGFREEEFPRADSNPVRSPATILVVGDSYAFGKGLEETSDRLGGRIQAHLRPEFPEIRVWTLARPGWSTRDQIEGLARYGPQLAPRVVVLAHCRNDIEDHITAERTRRRPPPGLFWLIKRSFAANDLFCTVETLANPGFQKLREEMRGAYGNPALWEPHAKDLRELFALVRSYDAEPVLLAVPSVGELPDNPAREGKPIAKILGEDSPTLATYERIETFARDEAIPFAGPLQAFAREGRLRLMVSRYDAHTNALAHDLMARAVVPFAREILSAAAPGESEPER